MNLDLNSKTAFISGSTQDIGFAIAKGLLKENAKVINGRRQEKIDSAIEQLKQEIPEAYNHGIKRT